MGVKVQPGWLADPQCNPIVEEIDPPKEFNLLPLGKTRELDSNKGCGFSCIVEILGGLLNGKR